jgi:hypothetical protein
MSRISAAAELTSREYKVMLNHRMFNEVKRALKQFGGEIAACFQLVQPIKVRGKLKLAERRCIAFLDTSDHLIDANRLLFRERVNQEKKGRADYTLKCRSPDRFVAAGADLRAGAKLKSKPKLEEDIGPPFVSRYSQSNTVSGPLEAPATLADARRYFPVLGKLKRDGARASLELELLPVNGLRAFERVYKGLEFNFNDMAAEVAVILWSNGEDGRPTVAEFSFRYQVDGRKASRATALAAMLFFERVQQMDWCLPQAPTKTGYIYRQ